MGAFAGLAAGLGGAAGPIQNWGTQVRSQLEARRTALADLVGRIYTTTDDPDTKAGLAKIISGLHSNAKMGDMAQQLMKLGQAHSEDTQKLLGVFPPPGQPPPPPPGPGNSPTSNPASGIPQVGVPPQQNEEALSRLIGGGGGAGGGNGVTPPRTAAPPVAQSPVSPTQPQAQNIGAMPAPPPMAAPAMLPPPQTTTASATAPVPIGQETDRLYRPGSQEQNIIDRYNQMERTPGGPSPGLRVQAEKLIADEAEFAKSRAMDRYLLETYGPAQLTAFKNNVGGEAAWNALPSYMKAGYAAQASHMQAVSVPFSMTNPDKAGTIGTAEFMQRWPDLAKKWGINPAISGPVLSIQYDKASVLASDPIPVAVQGHPEAARTAEMGTGEIGSYNPFAPSAGVAPIPGAVSNAVGNPVKVVNPNNPSELLFANPFGTQFGSAGGNIAGMPKVGSSQTLPSGLTAHEQHVVPPSPGASTPTGGGVTRPGTASGVGGGPGYKKSDVDSAVQSLLTPNMSEQQYNTTFKALVGPEKSPLAEAVRAELRARKVEDAGPIAWDIQTAERAQLSNATLTHIDRIKELVAKLDKEGQLGPVMSRWNEFWTGNIGSDLTKNQDYVQLKNQIGLLTKVMGRIHGGARGGGSIQMVDNFKKDLSQERMDANTLNGALDVEKEWLQTYANPKTTMKPGGGNSQVLPVGVPQVGENFAGGKVLKVERVSP